jgi:hypothetical protein
VIRSTKFLILSGMLLLGSRGFAQDTNFLVFVCFGQSNMEGFPGIEAQDKEGVDPRFRFLAVVSSQGCEARRDRLHFAPTDYREFGKRYAETMLPLLGYKPKALESQSDK